jgi:hypothetical protein
MGDISVLSGFLKYGPTGFAGLLLVLVIIALSEPRLGAGRERLLKQFMYIGAFCFTLSLAANFFSVRGSYDLYFRVLPIDLGANPVLPMPIITVNNTPVELRKAYLVKSEATAIIDVTDALNFAQNASRTIGAQQSAIKGISAQTDAILAELSQVPQIINNNCPGGASGRPAASNPAVLEVASKAVSAASAIKAAASSALQQQ